MSEQTHISWADSTINFWEGCTKVSAGCVHCYAEARDKRFTGGKLWGKSAPRRKSKRAVKDALRYNKLPWICDHCGRVAIHDKQGALATGMCECRGTSTFHRRRIFSLSLGDWLDPEVPIEWLAEMLDTIRQCDQVVWILCTKRPELWEQRMADVRALKPYNPFAIATEWLDGDAPENVWLLASVENQEAADTRIPALLKIPAAMRGLSLEPLLGPVDLVAAGALSNASVDWVIIGGESGPKARPCNVEWIRSLVQQVQAAGVAVHVKQLGSNVDDWGPVCAKIKDKKGGEPAEWPADLRVREFPNL